MSERIESLESWESDYRKLFRSCYGAYFAIQVSEHMKRGAGAPTEQDYDGFCEEASSVAVEAAERANGFRDERAGIFARMARAESQLATLRAQHGELRGACEVLDSLCPNVIQIESKGKASKFLCDISPAISRIRTLIATPTPEPTTGDAVSDKPQGHDLAQELKDYRKFIEFLSFQPCQMDAEGASEDTDCRETGDCITEWCWPCHARAVLSGHDHACQGDADA